MLLAVDIGNSNIVAGVMPGPEKVIFGGRFRTMKTASAADLKESLAAAFEENQIEKKSITAAIIASVVPEITQEMAAAVQQLTGVKPLILSAALKTGLEICMDNPEKVGADLIAASAAAAAKYEGPLAIFDLGTATTLSVISGDRKYLGTIIMPGVYISLNAMTHRASQLSRFNLEPPEHMLGKNTVESMQSGVMYGNAAMMDGLIDRVEAELGEKVTVLVTGGVGGMIQPFCRHEMIRERDLVLKGLWQIYQKNRPERRHRKRHRCA